MKCFCVYGEYGPVSGQSISRDIFAQNEQNARILFESYARRYALHLWERMGQHNVYVKEIK